MTEYSQHRKKWFYCQRCSLHETRTKVVLARGKIPCNVLFIGEAPGASEDVIGSPFVGPAGRVLDQIISIALDGQYDYALTNLVGCIPIGEEGTKTAEPSKESIKACEPRVVEMLRMCKPATLILVGKLAEKFEQVAVNESVYSLNIAKIIHPAAILRMDVSQQGLAIQRCIVAIEDALIPF